MSEQLARLLDLEKAWRLVKRDINDPILLFRIELSLQRASALVFLQSIAGFFGRKVSSTFLIDLLSIRRIQTGLGTALQAGKNFRTRVPAQLIRESLTWSSQTSLLFTKTLT